MAPFQFITTGEDNLRWRTYSTNDVPADGAVVELGIRQIDDNGKLQIYTYRQTVIAPSIPSETVIQLGRGAIVNLAVRYTRINYPTGGTYTTVDLIRGSDPASATILGQLLGDYITTGRAIAWPGSPIMTWSGHSNVQRRYAITTPTPATEATVNINFPTCLRLVHLAMTFSCSAVAGARYPTFEVVDAANPALIYARFPVAVTLGAGAAGDFSWGRGYGTQMAATPPRYFAPLPDELFIPTNSILRTNTPGMAAGDQWAAGYFVAEELIWPGL